MKFKIFCLITFGFTSTGIWGQSGGSLSPPGMRNYDFNTICTGIAKDLATGKSETVKFAISAFNEQGVSTVIIDRTDRDSQWIIKANGRGKAPEPEIIAKITSSSHLISWSHIDARNSMGLSAESAWIGRITKGTGVISMNFISRLDSKIIGGTEFNGLCENR
jgi:hypothetical protein